MSSPQGERRLMCSKKCRHKLVWITLASGKTSQVRQCQDPRYLAQSKAALESFRTLEVPADLLALITRVVAN
jgi:hypothetical protein